MRIIIIAVLVIAIIITLAAVGLASNPSSDPAVDSTTPTAEDVCLTTYLTASTAATAALARADAEVARSLDGLLTANDDASAASAISTTTAARVTYDDASAALADAVTAFQECAAN